ncbi:hypothetical protein B0H63DRAFT_127913 [Podospora didyma]|uniref:RBR-type E3 ubiquitin transferase n=1 Tax=Podospora didyma TaxID=330526 RepID=A0AAE0U594_9PEZI|nr:hypothetical protein B0H63DRAFT_127913 [Podospora didyma]
MAAREDADNVKGGPSAPRNPRRTKKVGKLTPPREIDWPPTKEPRPRPSPRRKRHGDNMESSDVQASLTQQPPSSNTSPSVRTASSSSTAATTTPSPSRPSLGRSASMRVPNSSVPVLARAATMPHRRPTCVYEEEEEDDDEDDDDDEEDEEEVVVRPRMRPDSRRSRSESRRELSPRSAHPYRSTPESRRSMRTSVPDSDNETDVTRSSDNDEPVHHHAKGIPVAPPAPAAPAAPTPRSDRERWNRRPKVEVPVYEDAIPERAPRHTHTSSFGGRRSPSRHSSAKRDQYRRPREVYREETFEDERSRSRSKRPSRTYYESEGPVSRPASSVRRPHAAAASHHASSQSLSSSKRSTFRDFLGSAPHPAPSEPPTRLVKCLVCMDEEKPVHKTEKLKCGHRMCHSCLRRNFDLSLADPQQHMPPRCCNQPIPIEHVDRLFDRDFKRVWNKKYTEYTTRNRIYCPSHQCGAWIRPEEIHRTEDGRKYAKCSLCKTKTCCSCKGRWHSSRQCPRDDDTKQFLEHAKREGMQRCYRCKHVVELKEGCNHMTCRCGAQFCMICGLKWKTCECSFFNSDVQENDPLDSMQTPMTIRTNPFTTGTGTFATPFPRGPPSPRDFRNDSGPPPPHAVRPRPQSWEEEMLLNHLRERRSDRLPNHSRDQQDEHSARKMPGAFGGFGDHGEPEDYGRGNPRDFSRGRPEDFGRDRRDRSTPPDDGIDHDTHRGRPVMDEYRRRPETVTVPSPPLPRQPSVPPPPHSTFNRSGSGLDYVSGVNHARGMRYVSPERRYGSPERYHDSPERQHHQPPDHWGHPVPPERRTAHMPETWQIPLPEMRAPQMPPEWGARSRGPSRAPSPLNHASDAWGAASRGPSRAASPERRQSHLPDTWGAPSRGPSRAPSPELRQPHLPNAWGTPSRGPSRAPSPERRRYPSPGRSQAPSSEQRHPPEADRRRATSLERRLASRFGKKESRQSAATTVGLMSPVAVMGPVGIMSPTRVHPAHPPPSRAATHPLAPSLPMAPVPPPAVPTVPLARRQTMMEEDVYVSSRHARSAEWAASPGRARHEHEAGSPHAPTVKRRPPKVTREHKQDQPAGSLLAGLAGLGRGMDRVKDWRMYVEPGPPEGEGPPPLVAQVS